METLPANLRKLISERREAVRSALRELRESTKTEATISGKRGEEVVIKPVGEREHTG